MQQYAKYLHPFVKTFCWCLLSNHFHFLIRVRSVQHIKNCLQQQVTAIKPAEKAFINGQTSMELLIELQWRRFFTSYAMAFNKQQQRKGNLFQRPFKRVVVDKESHFTQAIIYIHANAQRHGICHNFTQYQWSSYPAILSNKNTLLNRDEVLEWFGGIQ